MKQITYQDLKDVLLYLNELFITDTYKALCDEYITAFNLIIINLKNHLKALFSKLAKIEIMYKIILDQSHSPRLLDYYDYFLKIHTESRKLFEKGIQFEGLPMDFLTEDKNKKIPFLLKAVNKHF